MISHIINRMACGGCGHGLFKIHELFEKSGTPDLIVECASCKSESRITVTAPALKIEWTTNAKGRLTTMEPTSGI